MANYTITINMDNAAFNGGESGPEGAEIARILRELADDCESYGRAVDGNLRDFNGNTVGKAKRSK